MQLQPMIILCITGSEPTMNMLLHSYNFTTIESSLIEQCNKVLPFILEAERMSKHAAGFGNSKGGCEHILLKVQMLSLINCLSKKKEFD